MQDEEHFRISIVNIQNANSGDNIEQYLLIFITTKLGLALAHLRGLDGPVKEVPCI